MKHECGTMAEVNAGAKDVEPDVGWTYEVVVWEGMWELRTRRGSGELAEIGVAPISFCPFCGDRLPEPSS